MIVRGKFLAGSVALSYKKFMDLYRYFHPHHNPRLRHVPLRMQEVAELEQAANELKKAVERAKVRAESAEIGGIKGEHFSEILVALDYAVESLGILSRAHPGDEMNVMYQLLEERKDAPGWENWARLLKQRMDECSRDAVQTSLPNFDGNPPQLNP